MVTARCWTRLQGVWFGSKRIRRQVLGVWHQFVVRAFIVSRSSFFSSLPEGVPLKLKRVEEWGTGGWILIQWVGYGGD